MRQIEIIALILIATFQGCAGQSENAKNEGLVAAQNYIGDPVEEFEKKKEEEKIIP